MSIEHGRNTVTPPKETGGNGEYQSRPKFERPPSTRPEPPITRVMETWFFGGGPVTAGVLAFLVNHGESISSRRIEQRRACRYAFTCLACVLAVVLSNPVRCTVPIDLRFRR